MNYDDEDYLEDDDSLSEDEEEFEDEDETEDDSLDEYESDKNEDYVDTSDSGNDFSYSLNGYNSFSNSGFSQNDVNNIRDRINNRDVTGNQNTGVNKNSGNTTNENNGLEKKDELDKKDDTLKDGVGEKAKENASDKAKEAAGDKVKEGAEDKAKDVVADRAKEEAAKKATEQAATEVAGKAAASKAGIAFKFKIYLWIAIILLAILFIIGIIAAIAVMITSASNGINVEDIGNVNLSSSYQSISNKDYIWPIGSKETTESNGVIFALGNPVSTRITSEYGERIHPISGKKKKHNGIDIGGVGSAGVANVIAAKSGVVVRVNTGCKSYGSNGCGGGYGNYIMISHSDGKYTFYAHLHQDTINVKKNDSVSAGQVIAKVGSSGNSAGAHLHFEVRTSSTTRTNPLNYVDSKNPRPSSYSYYSPTF